MTETEIVVELIKEVGVGRLGGYDGCYCCHFKVRTVDIDICCGKGRDRGIYIFSRCDDYANWNTREMDTELLRPIAEEVAKQVEAGDGRGPIPIHYREWTKDDH